MTRIYAMIAGSFTGCGIGAVLFYQNWQAGFILLLIGLAFVVGSFMNLVRDEDKVR